MIRRYKQWVFLAVLGIAIVLPSSTVFGEFYWHYEQCMSWSGEEGWNLQCSFLANDCQNYCMWSFETPANFDYDCTPYEYEVCLDCYCDGVPPPQ